MPKLQAIRRRLEKENRALLDENKSLRGQLMASDKSPGLAIQYLRDIILSDPFSIEGDRIQARGLEKGREYLLQLNAKGAKE